MATETGVFTTRLDFINKLIAFAVANAGFVDEGTATNVNVSGTAGGTVRQMSRTYETQKLYWAFGIASFGLSNGNYFIAKMLYAPVVTNGTMTTSGLASTNPPGQEIHTPMGLYHVTEPFTANYKFMTDGDRLFAVIETVAGGFNHLGLGIIEKFGVWEGGEFLTAGFYRFTSGNFWYTLSNASHPYAGWSESAAISEVSYIRRPQGALDYKDFAEMRPTSTRIITASSYNRCFLGIAPGNSQIGAAGSSSMYGTLLAWAGNSATQRTPLIPMYVHIQDLTVTATRWILGGVIPGIRMCMMNYLTSGDVVDTNWEVYPVCSRNGVTSVSPDSGIAGIAYEII